MGLRGGELELQRTSICAPACHGKSVNFAVQWNSRHEKKKSMFFHHTPEYYLGLEFHKQCALPTGTLYICTGKYLLSIAYVWFIAQKGGLIDPGGIGMICSASPMSLRWHRGVRKKVARTDFIRFRTGVAEFAQGR